VADVLLGLGAAVVKVACKIWLKDHATAASASVEVVDIIESKVAGDLDQRHARRLFEDLEVPVAKKLGVLRQHEFGGMPDNEWTAAVLAVGDTLSKARITDADIFAGDLDPLYLRRHIVASAPHATRDLSEAGTALYDRLLIECCAYVVELTSTLPRFQAGAFAEMLRRQTVILQRFGEVLDRMPSPDQVRVGIARAEADFAAAYRRQVVNRLDRLELFGVTVSESIRGYPLGTAYISLTVASERLRARNADMKLVSRDGRPGSESEPGALRIDDALAGTSRLFLRGEAGSGKTTLLQWLAIRAARRDFPEQLAGWNESVPFLVRLRRHVGKDLPGPEGFLGDVGQHVADTMPKGWVHQLLREGQALVLIDGVDELPEAQRRAAQNWLGDLVAEYPRSKYVVTSRPAAASENWLNRAEFDAAEVQLMSWLDVREFVRHWHAAFRDGTTDEEQREQLSSCEQALLEALYAQRYLRVLATSPLLCALICALHLDRRMQLPDDRMELYEAALDMFLERRDIERQIHDDGPPLSKTDKKLLLEDLAYWLIRNGWSDAPKPRAVERITQRLTTMHRVEAEGTAVLDGLINRSGLIREPVAGRIDFVHRTFQEYLAAHAAVNEEQIGELIRNAHDDQWREVVVMAAGHAQPRQREGLLSGLLGRAYAEPRLRQDLQLLAVACLETSPELDPALQAQIQRVAESLLPPKSMRQAEILARTGEFLLDMLADRPARGARQAASTIRAASLVGGDAALKVIAAGAKFNGRTVRDEVMRAWPLFDVEEYARTVLSGSSYASAVTIDDPALLRGLRHIHGLDHLGLSFREGHGDLAVIGELPNVRSLNILEDPELRYLGPLTGHPALERVLLQGHSKADLRPLGTLPCLRQLLFRLDQVTSIEALQDCRKLEQIRLRNSPADAPLTRLFPQHPLHEFDLQSDDLRDLSSLVRVPQLAVLSDLRLSGCGRLVSIAGIEYWADTLQSFALWGRDTPLIDLAPLAGLPGLERLDLGWHRTPDLSLVRELPALRQLVLVNDQGVDLTPLHGVTQLTVYVRRGQRVPGADLLGKGSKVVRQ
jgi:hypothetical protein